MKNKKNNKLLRFIALCLALCCALPLSACESEPVTEADMQAKAAALAQALSKNDMAAAFEALPYTVKYNMNESTLEALWKDATLHSGKFVADEGLFRARWDDADTYVVEQALSFAELGVVVRCVFNDGFMEQVTFVNHDFFDDTPLPDGVTEQPVSVTLENGLVLNGVITLPAGSETVPAALLVPGSGALPMDSPFGKVKVMRDIAYGLAQNGVASLRLNKPTYESVALSPLSYSFDVEYVQPYTLAFDLLAAHPRVAGESVYLLGHSQAALALPRIDANVQSAGFVILSGSGRDLWETHYDQNMAYLDGAMDLALISTLQDERDKGKKLTKMTAVEAQTSELFGQNAYYYWEQVYSKVDTSAITKPVLLIRGAADANTFPADWDALLAAYANAAVTVREYPGLNHLLAPAGETGTSTDFYTEAHVDPTVISDIAAFVKAL